MSKNPDIQAFKPTTDLSVVQKAVEGKKPAVPPGKYKEFFTTVHDIAFSNKNIDMQTELEWDNIEGEVMAVILTEDILSGTMFIPVKNRLFRFRNIRAQMDKIFMQKFIEVLSTKPYLVPALTAGRAKLNELMVSYQRAGRTELVQMLGALDVSLSDMSKTDDQTMPKLRR